MVNKSTFKGALTGALACVALSGGWSQADSPKSLTLGQPRAVSIQRIFDFDSDWAPIQSFINAHAIVYDSTTVATIKDETRAGHHNWEAVGHGLGYPATLSTAGSMLYFDTEENCASCASQILNLASRQ